MDRIRKAFKYVMYRESKACVHVPKSYLDNLSKPVDEMTTCPQVALSSGEEPVYLPSLAMVMHRACLRIQLLNDQIRGASMPPGIDRKSAEVRKPESRWGRSGEIDLPGDGSRCYLPMQKLEKIRPSKSSELNAPVISPRDCCAWRRSSASSSPAPARVSCERPCSREALAL